MSRARLLPPRCSDGRTLTGPAPFEIRIVEETGSTNADMLQLAQSGLEEGIWLRALRQTGGRGRMGRAWEGQEGNLFASTIASLHGLGYPDWTADLVMMVLAEQFAYWLERWRRDGLSAITSAWLDRAHPAGTALRANLPDGTVVAGSFETLDAQGNLILRLDNGQIGVIHAGDIFLA